jgi:hypothetical protein
LESTKSVRKKATLRKRLVFAFCLEYKFLLEFFVIISLLFLFWKNESRLMRSPCRLFVCPPYKRLNGWTNLYETWYVYHGTWAHLNGILHKSIPSVCVSLCVSPYSY